MRQFGFGRDRHLLVMPTIQELVQDVKEVTCFWIVPHFSFDLIQLDLCQYHSGT
jgi:hypothetical protein